MCQIETAIYAAGLVVGVIVKYLRPQWVDSSLSFADI